MKFVEIDTGKDKFYVNPDSVVVARKKGAVTELLTTVGTMNIQMELTQVIDLLQSQKKK